MNVGQSNVPPARPESQGWGIRGFLLLLGFLPILLGELAAGFLFSDAPLQARLNREYQMQALLGQIELAEDPQRFFSRSFQRLERAVFQAPQPLEQCRKAVTFFQKRFPGMIELVFLDGTGRPVEGWPGRSLPRQMLQRFFGAYRSLLTERQPLGPTEQAFIKSFLGRSIPLRMAIHSRLLLGSPEPDRRYVYLSRPYEAGMFMLFLRPTSSLRQVAYECLLDRMHRANPGFRFFLAHTGASSSLARQALRVGDAVPAGFWRMLQRSPTGRAWFGDTLLAKGVISPSWWVIGATGPAGPGPGPGITSGPTAPWLRNALLLLLLIATWRWEPGRLSGRFPILGSVRVRVIAAFLYTALVPLLIMGLAAGSYLQNRRAVLQAETFQALENAMAEFDRSFDSHLGKLTQSLSSFYLRPQEVGGVSLATFLREFPEWRNRLQIDHCLVFDTRGTQVFEAVDPGFPYYFGKEVQPVGNMIQEFLARVNSVQGARVPPRDSAASLFGKELFRMIEPATPGCRRYEVGESRMFLSFLLLGDPMGKVTHGVVLLWDRERMRWEYIRRELPRFSRRHEGWQLLAWSDQDPGRCFPDDSPLLARVRSSLERMTSQARGFRQLVPRRGQIHLMSTMKGTVLDSVSFLGLASDQGIRAELYHLAWNVMFAVLLILGACVILGVLLARFFLQPLGALLRCMEAVSHRDFLFSPEPTGTDELGRLAWQFQESLGDLKDLEVARTVQECLFPRSALRSGDWSVCGRYLPATAVGGDFLEYSQVHPGRVRVFIGDVSGHGVGSALVGAMAKAILDHPDTPEPLPEVLNQLNISFSRILQGRKMMTAVLAEFDLAGRTLALANAGHCFPILVRGPTASFIELSGLPLGKPRWWRPNLQTFPLQPGDCVVFYSDGLLEALDGQGRMIGFTPFFQALPGLCRDDAEATLNAILDWHRAVSPARPPVDDIAVVVVQVVQDGRIRSGAGVGA